MRGRDCDAEFVLMAKQWQQQVVSPSVSQSLISISTQIAKVLPFPLSALARQVHFRRPDRGFGKEHGYALQHVGMRPGTTYLSSLDNIHMIIMHATAFEQLVPHRVPQEILLKAYTTSIPDMLPVCL